MAGLRGQMIGDRGSIIGWRTVTRLRKPAIDVYWPVDVLDLMLAGVGEIGLDTVPQALVNDGRNADPSGLRHRFEPSGDIDPVAINIAAVNHDVAEVDADAKLNAPALGDIGIPCRHAALDVDRAFDRVNDARELHERSIAHELDNPATMRRDGRVYRLGTVSL
jgi:hypothetical protein